MSRTPANLSRLIDQAEDADREPDDQAEDRAERDAWRQERAL